MRKNLIIGLIVSLIVMPCLAQEVKFHINVVNVHLNGLTQQKCVQVGLFMSHTNPQMFMVNEVRATLDYNHLLDLLTGPPILRATDFDFHNYFLARPGRQLTDRSGNATPCSDAQIVNIATNRQTNQNYIHLVRGDSASAILEESLDQNTGRISIRIANPNGDNFKFWPNRDFMFAVMEFHLQKPGKGRQGAFLGASANVNLTFVPDAQVPNGNMVASTTQTFPVTTRNGGVNVFPTSPDRIGVFRPSNNTFYLDATGDHRIVPGEDRIVIMGDPGDLPVAGDWNGDNREEIGVVRLINGEYNFFVDMNGDDDVTAVDDWFDFGGPQAPYLVGDWDGDGRDNFGLFGLFYRRFFLDVDYDRINNPNDFDFYLGDSGDLPVNGDWDGDADEQVGIFRPSTNNFYLDLDHDGDITAADRRVIMGAPGDLPLVGDWDGDGVDQLGLFRPSTNTFFLDLNNNGRIEAGDIIVRMGDTGDLPVVGRW